MKLKIFASSLFVLLFVLGALPLAAQKVETAPAEPEMGVFMIRTDTGALIIKNSPKLSFTLEFRGQEIKTLKSDHPVFRVDGRLVQVVNVDFENYWQPAAGAKTEPTEQELLEAHRKWESDYIGGELNSRLSLTSENLEIVGKKKALFWSFPMPKDLGSDYSHTLFLTTLIGKNILGLNASVGLTDDLKEFKAYLLTVMNTLNLSEKPFNIQEISKKIKEKKPVD
ncbi:MAG: hypothetical protein JSS81_20520 [Acidobacteria bacterium]|nr:hypothetical protein [Acidobacteriota bacterium]